MFSKNTFKPACALVLTSLVLSGCASKIENVQGKPSVYEDVSTTGSVGGVGIESQDAAAQHLPGSLSITNTSRTKAPP